MKINLLLITRTKQWAIPPKTGQLFRIGWDSYYCYFTFLGIAVLRFDHTMEWEW